MLERILTLCIDFEEFNLPQDLGGSILQEDQYRISFEGMHSLCNLLASHKAKATFFCTENMAKAFPDLLKTLVNTGHEVGLHIIIKSQRDEIITSELQRQKSIIEDIIGKKIYGCRSHKFVYLPSNVLKTVGLIYDNSLHPTYVPRRYCNIFSPRQIYSEDGIIKVPISVTPIFRLPFSWFWFRNFGLCYTKLCTRITYVNQEYINIYFHSWDFANNIEVWPLKWRYKSLIYNTGNEMLSRLGDYITWCRQKQINIITMFEYIYNKYNKKI